MRVEPQGLGWVLLAGPQLPAWVDLLAAVLPTLALLVVRLASAWVLACAAVLVPSRHGVWSAAADG